MKKKMMMAISMVLVLLMSFVGSVWADSDAVPGTGPASVDLNFTVLIPGFIYFQVGGATSGTGDIVTFLPTPQEIADGTPDIVADSSSGDVAVVLRANVGDIDIAQTTDGTAGLTSGGDSISYAQITTTPTGGDITPPDLTDGGTTTSPTIVADAAGVIDLVDQWTYTYSNPTPPPASGTYTGHVVYTAAIP